MIEPLLSVIICTYNREKLLTKCLNCLQRQKLDSKLFEILVIDNNSSDNTQKVLSWYTERIGNLRYIFERKQGLSVARNRGYRESKGVYLVYIDDDVIVTPTYLSNIFQVVTKFNPDILGGPVFPFYDSDKPQWYKDRYGVKKYADRSGFYTYVSITGANFVIKKKVLQQLGLFDVKFGLKGNDMGLGEERKILEQYRSTIPVKKQKVYYSLRCYVRHFIPRYKMNFSYLLKRSFIAGKIGGRINPNKSSLVFNIINFLLWIVITPIVLIYIITREILTMGITQVDYLQIFLNHASKLGNVLGNLK